LLIVNYRDYLINMLQLAKYWALFEIEKTGIYDKFPKVKRDYNLKQVKNMIKLFLEKKFKMISIYFLWFTENYWL